MQAFNHLHFVGIQRLAATKTVVHIFDLDDTLTLKPQGFDNTGLSKDEFFDASRSFPAMSVLPTSPASSPPVVTLLLSVRLVRLNGYASPTNG